MYRRPGPGPGNREGQRIVFRPRHAGWPKGYKELNAIEDVLRKYLAPSGWRSIPPGERWVAWWWSPTEEAALKEALDGAALAEALREVLEGPEG